MENLITCKICGKQSTRIYGAHLKSHGLTSNDYKKMFPGEPLYTDIDYKKTTINSGKHMKEDKYKKMFAEKIMGDKNPNSKIKTTEEERKKRSPFSKDFIKYTNENESSNFSKKVNNSIGPDKRPNNIEYWIKKGYDEENAIKKVSERQTTFSLDICIEKHGEKLGKEIWLNRQYKWMKNNKKSNFSKISQKLFWEIYNRIDKKENIFFATLNNSELDNSGSNNEYRLKLDDIIIKPDFFLKNERKIIEFDGTYYHRINPENKKRERKRDAQLISGGYHIYHVNENDYRKNPTETLNKCLQFLDLDINI